MRIIEHFQNVADAETSYVIPTDLYDQMMVLADRRRAGENVDAECRELVKVLYARRSELGAIIKFHSTGLEIHVGVRS